MTAASRRSAVLPVHPFPARMAPELALRTVRSLAPQSVVLDPMVGSGTTVRCASDYGHKAIGFDVDPLAVLMTRVWTTPIDVGKLRKRATDIVTAAKAMSHIDSDATDETTRFLEYWFGEQQRLELAALATVIRAKRGPIGDALRLALSRIVVTKERGASLARDISHSRPHKVIETSDYDVRQGFLRSVAQLADRLERKRPKGGVDISLGDARDLPILDNSIDAVITSPPYLNAIDYLRGHRLALVWLGFDLGYLREVRGTSIGTERGIESSDDRGLAESLTTHMGHIERLPERQVKMVLRYALDMLAVMREVARVIRGHAVATIVVGNSSIREVFLANDTLITECARRVDLRQISRRERALPPSRRYLPPPGTPSGDRLRQRMRTEVVLRLSPS